VQDKIDYSYQHIKIKKQNKKRFEAFDLDNMEVVDDGKQRVEYLGKREREASVLGSSSDEETDEELEILKKESKRIKEESGVVDEKTLKERKERQERIDKRIQKRKEEKRLRGKSKVVRGSKKKGKKRRKRTKVQRTEFNKFLRRCKRRFDFI
jgi:hypothetical protein